MPILAFFLPIKFRWNLFTVRLIYIMQKLIPMGIITFLWECCQSQTIIQYYLHRVVVDLNSAQGIPTHKPICSAEFWGNRWAKIFFNIFAAIKLSSVISRKRLRGSMLVHLHHRTINCSWRCLSSFVPLWDWLLHGQWLFLRVKKLTNFYPKTLSFRKVQIRVLNRAIL